MTNQQNLHAARNGQIHYYRYCLECGWGFHKGQYFRTRFCPRCGVQIRNDPSGNRRDSQAGLVQGNPYRMEQPAVGSSNRSQASLQPSASRPVIQRTNWKAQAKQWAVINPQAATLASGAVMTAAGVGLVAVGGGLASVGTGMTVISVLGLVGSIIVNDPKGGVVCLKGTICGVTMAVTGSLMATAGMVLKFLGIGTLVVGATVAAISTYQKRRLLLANSPPAAPFIRRIST